MGPLRVGLDGRALHVTRSATNVCISTKVIYNVGLGFGRSSSSSPTRAARCPHHTRVRASSADGQGGMRRPRGPARSPRPLQTCPRPVYQAAATS